MAKEMGKVVGGNAIRSPGDCWMRTWIFDKRLELQSLDNFWVSNGIMSLAAGNQFNICENNSSVQSSSQTNKIKLF